MTSLCGRALLSLLPALPHAPHPRHRCAPAQLKRRPTTTYMESMQTDINPMMRSILLDWLVEVGQEYRLTSDTLFLSAAYIDRYLSLVDVKRNRLQLVGVTAMLVASKYEEIYAPQVEEFCYITDNTYTREQARGRGLAVARCSPWPRVGCSRAALPARACQLTRRLPPLPTATTPPPAGAGDGARAAAGAGL